MKGNVKLAGLLLSAMALQPIAGAAATEPDETSHGPIVQAFITGKPIADIRYRFEFKEQDGFIENAYANTLRTRLGFETGDIYGFRILAEFENVVALGDDHFNSTTNGRTQFPVIADPDATELNRAQLTFTGIPDTTITLGRQRINLGNQRFVGAVDFRQNQQTFDAARVLIGPFANANVTLDYMYIDRVQRIFGNESPQGEFNSDSHVVYLTADGGRIGKLAAYGFLLDLEEAPAQSSATWGGRYENSFVLDEESGFRLGLVAEFATQSDYGDNPFDYREYYSHGELSANLGAFGLTGAYERLGGNGQIGFSTPLATLHKFQGFADVFLVTPADGLQDFYGTASYKWTPAPFGTAIKFFVTYHHFRTEEDARDFGNEIDAGMNVAISDHWSVLLKGAFYDGGEFGPADRNLLWTSLRFRY